MLLRTEDTPGPVDNPSQLQQVLDLAVDLTARYEISALSSLLASARPSIAPHQFRDRLSDRAVRAFGVPLCTTETEIDVERNWELLSLPVWMIKRAVHSHFTPTISYLIYQNLSRLASQWEEPVNGALGGVEKEAGRGLEELIETVVRLVESGDNERAPQLRADLDRLEKARKGLPTEAGS